MGRGPADRTGRGQIRVKVKAAGISPTDLALRPATSRPSRCLRTPCSVLRPQAPSAVGPGVTGTSAGDAVTALLFSLGGYAEYAVASSGPASRKRFVDRCRRAAHSAEAAAGVLRQLNVKSGETLLLFGGGGSVGIIATQLAVAQGVTVISAVGEHDEALARELGATPVRYGPGVAGRVRALGAMDAVFDAAVRASSPTRSPWRADRAGHHLVRSGRHRFGVTLSEPTPDRAPGALDETIALLADGRLRLGAQIHAHAAGRRGPPPAGKRAIHERIILTLP